MQKTLVCWLALIASMTSAITLQADDFTPVVGWDQQLYPALLISSATIKNPPWAELDQAEVLGDAGGLVGVRVISPGAKTTVKVTVTCDAIMEPSSFSGIMPQAKTEYAILPKIKYLYNKLADINQATPVSITFKVEIGQAKPVEQTATVTVHSINDCPFIVQVGEQQLNISHTFAAYVNEQHPYIDKLLREALDDVVVDSFTGYQGDDGEVIRQVYALWDLLVQRDVRYSNITATSVESESVASQHVRLIDQSLNNSQANCVDGSVLLASMLRKIGIEPFLVLVPGHCYVGFYLDQEQTKFMALETTLLGSVAAEGEEYEQSDLLEASVDEDKRGKDSWPSFCNAISTGSNHFEEVREKFSMPDETDYLLIDIAAARKLGVMSIAYRGKEAFKALERESADTEVVETDATLVDEVEVEVVEVDEVDVVEVDVVEVDDEDEEDDSEDSDDDDDDDDK